MSTGAASQKISFVLYELFGVPWYRKYAKFFTLCQAV